LKQLHLFQGEAVPNPKLTRKRIERMSEHAVPWVRPQRPKLPTAPLWRALAKRGLYVVAGLIEKTIPRAVAKRPTERNGKVTCFEPFEVQTCGDVDHLIAAFGPALGVADRRKNLQRREGERRYERRLGDCRATTLGFILNDDNTIELIKDRRQDKSPLYLAYPLLNRRWCRRRKTERRQIDGRFERRRKNRRGVERRKG
jgi:hypothetical protein